VSIVVRKAADRGHADHGWLDSRHTFSFAEHQDPAQTGFGALRVINDDRVQPGAGFPTHGHRNMEILSYVISGALEHRDSTGGGGVLRPGDVQAMSAGSGVRHSEFNASQSEPAHFLQIWILPNRQEAAPRYAQRHFADDERRGRLRLIASQDGADGSLTIHQDARVFATRLDAGERVVHRLAPGRRAWIQVATGGVDVNGVSLGAGDGAAVAAESEITLVSTAPVAQILLFDLP